MSRIGKRPIEVPAGVSALVGVLNTLHAEMLMRPACAGL